MSQEGIINISALPTSINGSNGITANESGGIVTISLDPTQFTSLPTGMQIKGNNIDTAPPAGFIGEQIRSVATVSTGSGVVADITSIILTPGIWDVSGIYAVSCLTGSISSISLALSLNSASFTGVVFGDTGFQNSTSGQVQSGVIPSFRLLVNANTTVFLVHQTQYSPTATMTGRISATRVG